MQRRCRKLQGLFSLLALAVLAQHPSASQAAAAQPPPPDLQVRIIGTANFQGRFTALVEDKATRTDSFYRVGDMLYGHRIIDISGAGMTLERGGRTFFLGLDGGRAVAPISSPARATNTIPVTSSQSLPGSSNGQRTFVGGQVPGSGAPIPGRATSSQMASAMKANPALARAMTTQGTAHLANAARPASQAAPTVWNNGRPVTAALPSATTPRLAQPMAAKWEDFSGLTNAPLNPDSPLERTAASHSLAAAQAPPNFYADGSNYQSSANMGSGQIRAVNVVRSAEDQRILQAAMVPGGMTASRNYSQPLALPRTRGAQAPGLVASAAGAAGAPFRAVGGLFGRGGRAQALAFPLADYNRLSSGFGYRRHPIGGNTRMHKGIDLSARPGTRIFSAAPGVVTWSGWRGGYGYCVIIDHKNGLSTLYGHCSKLVADVGDYVRAGEYIAEVGSTGASTGPHLHFEVHKNGVAVDPMPYLPMLQ
jgi:hypothetical protein